MSRIEYLQLIVKHLEINGDEYEVDVDVDVFTDGDGGFDIMGYYIIDIFKIDGGKANRVLVDEMPEGFRDELEIALPFDVEYALETL